jgi:hypothetical protein
VTTYTYQGGRRIALHDESTRFVSRASRYCLESADFRPTESISRHSWSVPSTAERIDDDLARARRLAPAYRAYTVDDTGSEFFVTDRIFVRLRAGHDVERFAAAHGLTVVRQFSVCDSLLRVAPTADVLDVVRNLTENERSVVEQVDHDLNIRSRTHDLRDPMVQKQWYLSSTSRDPLVRPCALLDCESAWKAAGLGSPDVVIGVVDCGCDLQERNFAPGKFAGWALFGDGDLCTHETSKCGPDIVYSCSSIHGTLAATLLASSADTYGGVGVAPSCRLLPVRWTELAGGTWFGQSSFLPLVEFLRERVDVVSCSWSTTPDGFWPPQIDEAIGETAERGGLHGKGIVWVWSAGNDNVPIEYDDVVAVPLDVRLDNGVATVVRSIKRSTNTFANLPNVLCVGAISSSGRRSHYSNYGKGLGVVAPSNNVHLYGRLLVSGREVIAPFGDDGEPYGGTSAAAALVAGVAALVRSANPDLTASEVVSILKRTAGKSFDMTPYESCSLPGDSERDWDISPVPPHDDGRFEDKGYPEGTWSPWFGFGKVNAGAAVREALRRAGRVTEKEREVHE